MLKYQVQEKANFRVLLFRGANGASVGDGVISIRYADYPAPMHGPGRPSNFGPASYESSNIIIALAQTWDDTGGFKALLLPALVTP